MCSTPYMQHRPKQVVDRPHLFLLSSNLSKRLHGSQAVPACSSLGSSDSGSSSYRCFSAVALLQGCRAVDRLCGSKGLTCAVF